ncbi:MAG: hypothetical protein WCC69_03920 [Pirellulales bacterium]
MNRVLSIGLAAVASFASHALADDKPLPAVKRILDKATLQVKKNRDSFDKANEIPLAAARTELQDLAKQLMDQGKADEAGAVIKQSKTLQADALAANSVTARALKDRLQGEWAKANHPHFFKIQGQTLLEFSENAPLKTNATGKIDFSQGKEYAVAKLDNGFSLWLFSAGEHVMAMEIFDPQGKLIDNGLVLYKRGFQP